MISPNSQDSSSYTIEPLSRLSLMLAIADARAAGLDHWANALVKLFMQMYPEEIR